MRRTSFTSLACAAALAAALILPAGSAAAEEAVLTVSGVGTARIAPDTAEVTVGVVTEARDAAKAHADNAAQVQRVMRALQSLGVAPRDMQTMRYDFSPVYDMRENGRSSITGYTVSHALVITVRSLDDVGRVIDTALASGANRGDALTFTASDVRTAKNAALHDAVLDARRKAETMADALGVRIVRLANVYADAPHDAPRNAMPMMMEKAAFDAATPIAAGELSYDAAVNVTYVIE